MHLLDAMTREGFEEVIAWHDRDSGVRGWIAIHDSTAGPAFGGIRRFSYRTEAEAMMDCLRLSRAMTDKCRLANLPAGGGKVVLLDEPNVDWDRAYAALGRKVESMGGRFYTGPDVGTGEQELSSLVAETRFATDPGPEGPGELGASTAEGVFRGMQAALLHLDGKLDWPSQKVVVQGLGAVGRQLAKRLVEQGAQVVGSDVDTDRMDTVMEELGIEGLDSTEVLHYPCDVLAPCAMGGLIHDLTLERLKVRVIAGGANNVLARTLHGDRLHNLGILYVPDFVINCGALIRGTVFHLEARREPVSAIGERVANMVSEVLEEAAKLDSAPTRVARRLARQRLQDLRDSKR
ncbi:MAG: glutamate dehydrogenase/leucine dehydrogenase [Planctomycetota bacterium]|jgi:glutamate dehydrogenase/leucine dehydrogenase